MSDKIHNRRPLRVLFVDHTAALSGGEIAMLELIRHLDRRRCEPIVALCAAGSLVDKLAEAGVEHHVLPLGQSVVNTRKDGLGLGSITRLRDIARVIAYSRRLARFIREHQIDLVHTNSLKADILGGLAARLARRPLLWHVRDRIDADYLPRPVVAAFRGLCRLLPHCVVANSDATLRTLKLPRSKPAAVIYSGIPAALTHRSDGRSAPPPGCGARIGLVGRIARWKGQHVFIEAAARLHRRFPAASFQIIGAAMFEELEYEREVRGLAASLGLNGSIEFTGFREDAQDLIAELDILVHASIIGEPFGKVIVEGMAAGKPVVATEGGGVPEIVEHGVTGLLVPMGDAAAMAEAVGALLAHPAAAEMGRRGRQRVRDRFTIDIAARRLEDLYDRLVPAPRPTGSVRPNARRVAPSGAEVNERVA